MKFSQIMKIKIAISDDSGYTDKTKEIEGYRVLDFGLNSPIPEIELFLTRNPFSKNARNGWCVGEYRSGMKLKTYNSGTRTDVIKKTLLTIRSLSNTEKYLEGLELFTKINP